MTTQKKPSALMLFLKTTFTGFLIIVPILGAIYLFRNLFIAIEKQVNNIIEITPLDTSLQVFIVFLVSLLVLILIAYAVGMISKTDPLRKMATWLDMQLMDFSDVYRSFKLNVDNNLQFLIENKPPVFVRFGESERPGFLMEQVQEEARAVVFIPKDFNRHDGNIYIVPNANVRMAKAEASDFIYAMEHLGSGMNIA